MSPESQRILIVTDGHDASLLSLYDYFTFRGYRVDCADRIDDARALVRHVFYHAVIAAVRAPVTAGFGEFLYDVRSRHVGTRILAVCDDAHRNEVEGSDVDGIVPHGLPISHLARLLRHAIAHSTTSP